MSDTTVVPIPATLAFTGPIPLVTQTQSTEEIPNLNSTLRNLFPNQKVPLMNADGTMANEYYRAFRFVVDILLGGVNAIPLADIVNAVNFSQSGVKQLQDITNEMNSWIANNAAVIAALTISVQAALASAASAGAAAGAAPAPMPPPIPPVQPSIPSYVFESPGGGD